MKQIKAYVGGQLIRSKKFNSQRQYLSLIQDLEQLQPSKAYLCENGSSKEIPLFNASLKRPIYYTRSDGEVVGTLSVHPYNYPMIAHFADGSTEII